MPEISSVAVTGVRGYYEKREWGASLWTRPHSLSMKSDDRAHASAAKSGPYSAGMTNDRK